MYSLWNRLNAVFFYAVTAIFFAAAASSITTLWFTPAPKISKLKLTSVQSLRAVRETRFSREAVDRAFVHFDLDADLRGVWNWNVKQLYVYVLASYQSDDGAAHELVLWDSIATNVSSSKFKLSGVYNDYPLFDRSTDLRGRPITLSLAWDVMPITGYLYRDVRPASRVRMPAQYCNAAECSLEPLETLIAPSSSEGSSAASDDGGRSASRHGAAAGAASTGSGSGGPGGAASGSGRKARRTKDADL